MDTEQRRAIAQQIREAREVRGWSPERLASEAGLSDKTVRSLEAGNNVRPGSLAKTLEALDLEPESERIEREGVGSDVRLVLDMIQVWLSRKSPEDRPEAVYDLVRYLSGREK